MMTTMIRGGLAAAALLIAPLAAQAADINRGGYKAPIYSAPGYANWSGFYLGLNGGYGFGKSNWDFPAVSPSPKGGLFGVTLGYNFQTGAWLWGAEGDIDYSTMKGSADCAPGVTCETKNSWLATARGRLGYAGWDRWLPYITGGGAYGQVKMTPAVGNVESKNRLGYTFGAGVEYALLANWTVKAEYLYVDLGTSNCSGCGVTGTDVTFKENLIRAGLNYRF